MMSSPHLGLWLRGDIRRADDMAELIRSGDVIAVNDGSDSFGLISFGDYVREATRYECGSVASMPLPIAFA